MWPKIYFQHVHLIICPRVGEDEKAGLAKGRLELIGEGTRCVPPCNGMSTSILRKLQDSPLPIWPCRLNNNILRVLNGNNNPGSKLKFLPGFAKVDDEDTWIFGQRKFWDTRNRKDSFPKTIRSIFLKIFIRFKDGTRILERRNKSFNFY